MRLKRLEIRNYKSLRDVVIEPTPLTVLVGPNAAGKSNFADALDFLGEVYRWDLEGAVAKKGGLENILYRNPKRASHFTRFRICCSGLAASRGISAFDLDHSFEVSARPKRSLSEFYVSSEGISIYSRLGWGGPKGSPPSKLALQLNRYVEGIDVEVPPDTGVKTRVPVNVIERVFARQPDQALCISSMRLILEGFMNLPDELGALRLFQLNPRFCREAGIPTPNPVLDRSGSNLPAVMDYLKKNHAKEYAQLIKTARRIMPSLESIETDFTHTKTLGLFLRESGFKRPWTSEDISDGTIQAIALLAATFDPRIKILVIEEPENSVHPWAIRTFVEAFRLASAQKQIILTTHSPILIDQIRPEELWLVRRPGAETLIDPVLTLDPSLKDAWGQGKFTLSEYLDSGALPEAVPAASA
jgi:predicted ATPase